MPWFISAGNCGAEPTSFSASTQRDFFEYLNRNPASSFSCSVGTIVVTIRTAIVMPAGP